MPEGPSILILRDLAHQFVGQRIQNASGSATTVDMPSVVGQTVLAIRSWGKHLLIQLPVFTLRIHLLMFGSYRINERKEDANPRLSLQFANDREINFYTCSVKQLDATQFNQYDWRRDVMSDEWDPAFARKQLRAMPETLVCDALLDQTVFSGVGNIIKNEVLFRLRIHPLSTMGALPAPKLRDLVTQARQYSFEFLGWKKANVLRAHWLAHNKQTCPRCAIPFMRAHLGKTHRRSFFCENCQRRYVDAYVDV